MAVEESTSIGEGERVVDSPYFQSAYDFVSEGMTGSQFSRFQVRCCLHVLLSRYRRVEYLKRRLSQDARGTNAHLLSIK